MKKWHCGPENALREMWPDVELSMGLLQNIHQLSKMCTLVEARRLLADMIHEQAPAGAVGQWVGGSYVQPIDVLRAIERIKARAKESVSEEKLCEALLEGTSA